jgi:hypothetical protein
MRFPSPFAILALLALAGCQTTGGQTSSSSTGGSGRCDNKDDCDQCTACAKNNPCAVDVDDCNANAACIAIDECLVLCGGNASCRSDCYTNNPAGVADFEVLRRCIYCEECQSDCAGFETCE